MTLENLTQKKRNESEDKSPCVVCRIGWVQTSEYRDKESDDLMRTTKHCQDDCEILKKWNAEEAI